MNCSKRQPVVFLGASTAFFEISEIIRDINNVKGSYEIIAVLDDNPQLHGSRLVGVPVMGSLDLVHQYPDALFVFGIGSFKTRLVRNDILKRLNIPDERFVTLIHPSSKIYPSATICPGCIVYPGVVICNDVVLDPFSIITFNSVVGPYAKVGRCAMVTTMVVVLSGVQIGRSAFIGVGSVLAERIKIGPGAVVIMGSIVLRSVKPGAFVQGNPARLLYRAEVPAELMLGLETIDSPQ